jgi:hypothetical protein
MLDRGSKWRENSCKIRRILAPAGFEPLLGGSGESRPLPIRVILQGFSRFWFPAYPVRYRPFPTAPLENVRKPIALEPNAALGDRLPRALVHRPDEPHELRLHARRVRTRVAFTSVVLFAMAIGARELRLLHA